MNLYLSKGIFGTLDWSDKHFQLSLYSSRSEGGAILQAINDQIPKGKITSTGVVAADLPKGESIMATCIFSDEAPGDLAALKCSIEKLIGLRILETNEDFSLTAEQMLEHARGLKI